MMLLMRTMVSLQARRGSAGLLKNASGSFQINMES